MSRVGSGGQWRLLCLLLLALLAIDVSWTAAVNHRVGGVEAEVEQVESDQHTLSVYYGVNHTSGRQTTANVSLYAYEKGADEAVAVPTRVVSLPADGVYTDVDSVAQTAAFQRAVDRSWTVARDSRTPPPHRGVVVQLHPPRSWDTVGGGSAALSLGIAFAATDPCRRLNGSVATTGGLTADGEVITVDYVRAKAVAARRAGADLFLVPPGQTVEISGIEVREVASFGAAADYALTAKQQCTENPRASNAISGDVF